MEREILEKAVNDANRELQQNQFDAARKILEQAQNTVKQMTETREIVNDELAKKFGPDC